MQVSALDHLVLTVSDIEASLSFYARVLGMTAETFTTADGAQRRALRFGQQKINLHEAGREFVPHAKTPIPGSADLCFLSAQPLADWITHFEICGVPLLEGPVARTGATGALTSLYIRDPDGNLIEVSNKT